MKQRFTSDSLVSELGTGPAFFLGLNPGDEIVGCAGAVFAHLAQGEAVTIVSLTDGTPDALESSVVVMTPELAQVHAISLGSGYPQSICWNLRRRAFSEGEALVARIMRAIRESNACLVYAPAPTETHLLRQIAAMAAQEAVYRIGGSVLLAQYAVENDVHPNRSLDIQAHLDEKAALLRQAADRRWDRSTVEQFNLRTAIELRAENQLDLYGSRCAMVGLQVQLAQARLHSQRLDRQLADSRADQARLQQELGRKSKEYADAVVHVSNLDAVITVLRADSAGLRRSLSWRATRPLRAVTKWFRKARAVDALPATDDQTKAVPVCTEYENWIERYERLHQTQLATLRLDIEGWQDPPLLSILMPVYDTPQPLLCRAIDSVLQQSYPHWELCIADDASPSPHIQTILEEYSRRDRRIKLVARSQNGHIAAASNSALTLARGTFVCLLDHDDKLACHALYFVACAIRAYPDKDLFYSDEDKIDNDGRRFEPYFKPDWNPDLFLAYNFFNHLGVVRKSLMDQLGGFRVGYEGAEDYDLVLRAIARVGHGKVHHIPHVLYHWGLAPGSTAIGHEQKPYALGAAIRAVREHLAGESIHAEVTESSPGSANLRVRYILPDPPPFVSIIIATHDAYALLSRCLDSIFEKTIYPCYEVIIVDNRSEDPMVLDYLQSLQKRQDVRVLRDDRPFNYSALNNAAAQQARGEVLCLMNNDVEVISTDWLQEMVSHAVRPEIGMVGCRLWFPDDTLQHAGVILGVGGVAGHAHHRLNRTQRGYFSRASLVQNYSAVTAACSVVRASVFRQVQGFNERHLAIAFNDIDLCLRIRDAGYRNLWTPFAELYHFESATRGYEDTPEKRSRFEREKMYMLEYHKNALLNDPAYNPNLALELKDFTLAYPPRIDRLAVG
jgi:GT2 family glycosyltransferase/LmbE family N-acetylglucosaminyl deacetylase